MVRTEGYGCYHKLHQLQIKMDINLQKLTSIFVNAYNILLFYKTGFGGMFFVIKTSVIEACSYT